MEQKQKIMEQDQKIIFSKFNPLIIKSFDKKTRANFWYSVIKFLSAIIIGVWTLLSLYFANLWGANSLSNLGIDFGLTVVNGSDGLATAANIPSLGISIDPNSSIVVGGLSQFSNSSFSEGLRTTLLALGFLTIILIIITLVFKNGTAYSIGFLAISWILFIITFAISILGIQQQTFYVDAFKSFKDLDPASAAYKTALTDFLKGIDPIAIANSMQIAI